MLMDLKISFKTACCRLPTTGSERPETPRPSIMYRAASIQNAASLDAWSYRTIRAGLNMKYDWVQGMLTQSDINNWLLLWGHQITGLHSPTFGIYWLRTIGQYINLAIHANWPIGLFRLTACDLSDLNHHHFFSLHLYISTKAETE